MNNQCFIQNLSLGKHGWEPKTTGEGEIMQSIYTVYNGNLGGGEKSTGVPSSV